MGADLWRGAVLLSLIVAVLAFAERRWGTVTRFAREQRAPLDLAIVRVVVFSLLLLEHTPAKLLAFARLPSQLLLPADGWGHLARLMPRGAGVVAGIYVVFALATACAIAGFLFRWTGLLATFSGLYLFTLPQLWGKVDHDHHLLLFATLLSLSPSADALSVDRWLRERRGEAVPAALVRTRRHGAPLVMMMTLMVLMYLFPGVWKVSRAGLGWFSGETMRLHMLYKLQEEGAVSLLQMWALARPSVLLLGSVFGALFEIGFVFLVLPRRTRPIAVLCGIAFHCGTFALMGISFFSLQASYVALIDWAGLVKRGERVREDGRERVPMALRAVFGVVIAGMLAAGVTHTVDGWPVACYPTFDWRPEPIYHALRLEAADRDGTQYAADLTFDRRLGERYSADRWRVMTLAGIGAGRPYPSERGNALVGLWAREYGHPELVHAALFWETRDAFAGEGAPPVRGVLLAEGFPRF